MFNRTLSGIWCSTEPGLSRAWNSTDYSSGFVAALQFSLWLFVFHFAEACSYSSATILLRQLQIYVLQDEHRRCRSNLLSRSFTYAHSDQPALHRTCSLNHLARGPRGTQDKYPGSTDQWGKSCLRRDWNCKDFRATISLEVPCLLLIEQQTQQTALALEMPEEKRPRADRTNTHSYGSAGDVEAVACLSEPLQYKLLAAQI